MNVDASLGNNLYRQRNRRTFPKGMHNMKIKEIPPSLYKLEECASNYYTGMHILQFHISHHLALQFALEKQQEGN